MVEALLKYLGSIPADKAGLWFAGFVAAAAKIWFPYLSRWVTRLFMRNRDEINALGEREVEEQHAAEVFRLTAILVDKQEELERVERERDRWRLLAQLYEEGKLEAEMELAEWKIERKTGQHRALLPAPRSPARGTRSLDDKLDTDRPRSASRVLPPPSDSEPPPTPVVPGGRRPGRRDRP